jgi:sensitive to high expression protein 9, mitochondrial
LLERKHSWSAGDLERYMSLIRSEHINDQAIRQAKDSVISAEAALEEARTQLEKRERAQYHEEQIWSDTIRRNSTWVTFGLMGVNIFLLLLSLAILEPWRRRRMVREIKSALQAQMEALDTVPASLAPALVASPAQQELAAIEEEIDLVTDAADVEAVPDAPIADAVVESAATDTDTLEGVVDPVLATTAPEVLMDTSSHTINAADTAPNTPKTWKQKVTFIAQDIISDRLISMRRIDYTTAILQGAAAGAVITAAIIGMLRPT